MNGRFSKEDLQVTNKHMKRCLISRVIGRCQSIPNEILHHTHQEAVITGVGEDVDNRNPLVGVENGTAAVASRFLKRLSLTTPLLSIHPREIKTHVYTKTCT